MPALPIGGILVGEISAKSVRDYGFALIESPPTASHGIPNSNPKVCTPPVAPILGVKEDTMGGFKIVLIEMSTCSTYVHTICLSCAVWPQYTARQTEDGQTDRAIGIGRLCNGIDSIIKLIKYETPLFFSATYSHSTDDVCCNLSPCDARCDLTVRDRHKDDIDN